MTNAPLDRSGHDPAVAGPTLPDLARTMASVALVAAGVIHFAYAPVHLDEAFSHGMFFLTAGWLQIGLAAALAFRVRPERAWWALAGLVNLAIIATWVISRTAGIPGSDREEIGFTDVTATGLEVVVVAAVAVLLLGWLPSRQLARLPAMGLTGIGAVASVVLVSVAVSPSFAGDHAPGQGGHAHGGESHGADGGEAMAAHDHGAVAATGADWARARVDALAGYATPDLVEEFKRIEGEYLAGELRERSDLLRSLPEAEREERVDAYVAWALENTIALLEGAQGSTGDESMHTHGPVEWQPITDPQAMLTLQEQLRVSGEIVEQFPTIADAEAGGYRQISPYVPGIGAHWINGDFDDSFDPARPEMLLYNGTEPTSEIVGLSYAATGSAPPEGFVGPNDQWHAHTGLCLVGGLVVGIDGTPEDLCESVGGQIASGLGDLWMMHLWQVPGWESSWGLFSAENPQINVATSDIGRALIRD